MSDDQNQGKKGFAGLNSMVSHVDVPEPPPAVKVEQPTQPDAGSPWGKAFEIDEGLIRPAEKKFWSQTWFKWTAGISIVVLIIIAASNEDKPANRSYSSTSSSNSQYTYTPTPAIESSYEEMPPVGSGLVLGSNQIRYCLSQSIRLESWSTAVNTYSDISVNVYNLAVNDYNNRCSNYRYKKYSIDAVRAEVELRRSQLVYEGLAKGNLYR